MKSLSIVTGGSRGVGKILVERLLEQTSVLSISRSGGDDVRNVSGNTLYNLTMDLANVNASLERLGAWLDEQPKHIVTRFISNAALLNLSWIQDCSYRQYVDTFSINVFSPFQISSLLMKRGLFSRGSKVVYVTSSLARQVPTLSFAGLGLYSSSKAALSRMALVQARECELLDNGVSIVTAHPGIVATDMQTELRSARQIDPAFAEKTAGLPDYQEGDWRHCKPYEAMRTINSEFSADFILWVCNEPSCTSGEFDFYHCDDFHRQR